MRKDRTLKEEMKNAGNENICFKDKWRYFALPRILFLRSGLGITMPFQIG
jgi:hypothetical protein